MSDTRDYASLFLNDVPLMDTRAPVEFARGSFPHAQNLPLLTDDERARVGTRYRENGQSAAIELGYRLVGGTVKEERVAAWLDFARRHPGGYLFCFRGGLRSEICQQWMREAGCAYPRVLGGYKAMRRFLLEKLETLSRTRPLIVLGGHTGAAKTALLQALPNSVDLEALAGHRGSAFGKRPGGQPSQIGFENSVAVALLKQAHFHPHRASVLEDESYLIGRCRVPQHLQAATQNAPLVLLESDFADRVEHTFHNYILGGLNERIKLHGTGEGFENFCEYLQQSLFNIRRRLGGVRYQALLSLMQRALADHRSGNAATHKQWIEILLREYYDPMYEYQLRHKKDRVVFRGKEAEVFDYLRQV